MKPIDVKIGPTNCRAQGQWNRAGNQPMHWQLAIGLWFVLGVLPAQAGLAEGTDGELRLVPSEFAFGNAQAGGTGTYGVLGIQTLVLKGDPNREGHYTILLSVPARTRIMAHDHRDDRIATVVSGTWRFGYGDRFDDQKLKALPPGIFFTEPARRPH